MIRRARERGSPIGRRTVLSTLVGLAWQARAWAQAPAPGAQVGAPPAGTPAAGAGAAAGDWPKVVEAGGQTITVYLPQLDSWDGHRLEAHAAVSIQASASAQPRFDVVSFLADTQVDNQVVYQVSPGP